MSESATPIRVLLVEDNPGDARLIAEMLAEAAGSSFALRQARSLGAALESFGEPDVQAVLLDLGLPDSDGIATLAAIRPASHDVPIIVLTGNDDEELALSAVRAGAQDYLV
jgi:DNA-binding response OmpR family regulator